MAVDSLSRCIFCKYELNSNFDDYIKKKLLQMKPFEKEVIKIMQNKIIIGFMHIHHLKTYYRTLVSTF